MGFPNQTDCSDDVLHFWKKRSLSLNPPTGAEKTQEACMWMSPNCLMCLFLLILLQQPPKATDYSQRTSDFQTWESSWGLPTQKHRNQSRQNTQRAKQKIAKRTPQRRRGKKQQKPDLTSLDCLETWSWLLVFPTSLFSNVRIIFFTELSSNGSSWCKETTISVQRIVLIH